MRRIVSVYGSDLDLSEKKLQRRSAIIEEIIHTEESYVSDMETLLKLFVRPLLQETKSEASHESAATAAASIMKHDDVDHLFSCIPVILKSNSKFLTAIKATPSMSNTITGQSEYVANTMQEHIPQLGGYTQYLSVFQSASAILHEAKASNTAFAEFLRNNESRGRCRTDFFSMLIMPVQRIPRYRLLVQELLGHTSALHVDHMPLTQCLKAVTDTAARINAACDNIGESHHNRLITSLLNAAKGIGTKLSVDETLIMETEVQLVRLCNCGSSVGSDGDVGKSPSGETKANVDENTELGVGDSTAATGKTKYKYKVILYAHALYLVRIDGSHEWEVVSVAQIDGTLSATLTNDNSVMVHWAGADRYEVACDDFC